MIEHPNPFMSGRRLKSTGTAQLEPGSPKSSGPRRGSTGAVGVVVVEGIDLILKRGDENRSRTFWDLPCQTFRLAASVRRQASRARLTSSGRSIPRWFECGRTFGTRRYGSRIRTSPIPASTAACGSAGTSGNAAAGWRKHPLTRLTDIRAWQSLR